MSAYVKINSSNWKHSKVFVKTGNSTWSRAAQVYVKTSSNKWSPIYSYSWETGQWGSCTPYCSGTQTRTVKCKNNTLNIYEDDGICSAFVGTKPSTSQSCSNSCGMSISYHWDDHGYVAYKSRSTNSWIEIGVNPESGNVTLSFTPAPSDWPLRMRVRTDNSGGHGCGSFGMTINIPNIGDREVISNCWGNYGGCDGYMYWRVNANGVVERLACNLGTNRCTAAGYPYASGEPSW